MKKILYAVLIIIAVSCKATTTDNSEPTTRTWGESPTEQPEFVSRIIEKESKVIRGYRYVIIEIDGHEYLSAHECGIIALPKNE